MAGGCHGIASIQLSSPSFLRAVRDASRGGRGFGGAGDDGRTDRAQRLAEEPQEGEATCRDRGFCEGARGHGPRSGPGSRGGWNRGRRGRELRRGDLYWAELRLRSGSAVALASCLPFKVL